jgi:hypothetical protein
MENNIDLDNIHFNHLFAKASEDELVISFQEIESQILNAPLKHKPLKFSRAHILFISLPFILFVLFILYNTDKSPRTHTNSLTSVTSVNKDTVQNTDQISLPIARKIQANFHPKQKPIVVKNIRFEPTPKVQENVEQVIAPFYPQELPSGELILSYEELAKLHIYTDGCELKYTNLRDSLYTNRSVLRKRQSRIHYYTEIQSSGGSYTMNNSVLASDSMMRVLSDSFLPAYPMFIEKEITFLEKKSTTLNVGDVTTDMLELKSPLTVAQDYVYEAKKLLVPIRVELKAKANMYGRTDYDLIFWFKPNKEFCDMLPTQKAVWVRQNYAHYTDQKYSDLIKNQVAKKQQREEILKSDSVIYANDLLTALVLNDKQLKSLGFKKNSKGEIQYKVCYQKKMIEVYGFESQYPPSMSFIGNYGFMGFLKGINTKTPAHFVTDEGVNFYQLTKETNTHSLDRYDKNFQNRQQFKQEKDNLLPVLIQVKRKDGTPINWYFWFNKTDAFYKILPQKKTN